MGERGRFATTSLYLVLKSNGPHRSKNPPVRFSFSPKTVPANIAQKLPPQRCPQPLLIPIFNFSHKWPTFALTPESGYTHSVFGERSHTAAYTPKHGPSLPRPQCGFALPVKSLLFRHAFIYIHFPVLCEPSPSAKGENPAKLPPRLYLKPFFNFSHKRPTFAFTDESEYTLGSLRKIAHNGLHGETVAVSDGGGITALGAFHTFRKPCVARYQNGVLCRFGILAGGAPKERRKPSEQRCAYARRCSEASRPRWAALLCLQLGDVTVLSLCAQYFLNVRGEGWYHYPRRALRAAETPDGRLSKWFICRFPGSLSTIPCAVTFSANMQISLSAIPVANTFALWYDKSYKSGLFGDEGEPE